MITADNITDEQIRELRDHAWEWFDLAESNAAVTECSLALAKFRHAEGLATVRAARARCAEILNARRHVISPPPDEPRPPLDSPIFDPLFNTPQVKS